MMLGTVEFQPLAAAAAAVYPSLTLAQSQAAPHAGTLPAAVSPALLMTICLVAAAGTYLLLPGRLAAASRGVGGVLLLFAGLLIGLTLVRFVMDQGESVDLYFWSFAVIAIVGALRVVTHPRPVYAALYFVLTVFATAGLFILLWAEFMAAALVLIYAGAILVTYVFVIMLAASSARAGVDKLGEYDAVSREPLVAAAVGFALTGVLLFVILDRAAVVPVGDRTFTYVAERTVDGRTVVVEDEVLARNAAAARDAVPTELTARGDPVEAYSVQALGRYLFRAQGINLELAGLLLTLGMVGAILIARRRVIAPDGGPAAGGGKDTLTAPATPVTDDPFSIPVYGTDNPRQKAYPET
jgi:NADH-quinone oxidoreductase subunit J